MTRLLFRLVVVPVAIALGALVGCSAHHGVSFVDAGLAESTDGGELVIHFDVSPMPAAESAEYPVMSFQDESRHPVAALYYDKVTATCYQTGDMAAAFRIVYAMMAEVSEERDRLRWGDRQVDQWRRDRVKWERERYRREYGTP